MIQKKTKEVMMESSQYVGSGTSGPEEVDQPPVVLVTGAARRIGAAIATLFHRRGCRVLVHCNHSVEEARSLVEQMNRLRGNSAALLQADLCEGEALGRLARQALSCFGRLDVLINNASAFYPTPLASADRQQWNELMDSNLGAAFFLCQALAPALQESQGSIVNIIDSHADQGLKQHPIYSIAKAGLKMMTRSLARELAPLVRVNGVSPGAILWPAGEPFTETRQQAILRSIPLGRLGRAEDIAETAWFLAIEASYITGQTIRVDGGRGLLAPASGD